MSDKPKIGAIIALDGEKEFKSAVAGATKELTRLKSESNLLKAQFEGQANTMKALSEKHENLKKILEVQEKKQEAVRKGLEHAKESYEKVGNRLETLKKDYEDATKKLDEMRKAGNASEKEMQEQEKAVTDLAKAVKKEEEIYQRAANRIEDWKTKQNNADAAVISANKNIKINAAYMKEAEKSADRCATSIDAFGKKTSNADVSVKKSAEAFSNLAGIMVASEIGQKIGDITDELDECAKAADSVNSSMAMVSTLLDGNDLEISDRVAELSDEISTISSETGMLQKDLNNGLYNVVSAFGDSAEAAKQTELATKGAVAGGAQIADSINLISAVTKVYGDTSLDAQTKVSDLAFQTVKLGQTTFPELASSMQRVTAMSNTMGISQEELFGQFAGLTGVIGSASEVSTKMGSALSELMKPSDILSAALQGLGYSTGQEAVQALGLQGVMIALYDSVEKNANEFGNLFSSTETTKFALASVGDTAETITDKIKAMSNAAGSTESAYKKMANASNFAKNKMNNAAENLRVAIGTELNNSLKDMYRSGEKAFDWATKFVKDNPGTVRAIGALTAGIGGATIAVAGFSILPKITSMVKIFNAALAANPAGMIAIAITTLISAVGAYVALSKEATNETKEFVDAMEQERETIQSNISSRQESVSSTQAEWQANQMLVDKLYELNDVQDKTSGQKAVMKGIVDQLKGDIPELASAFDKETGSINMSKTAIDQLIDSQKEYAMLNATTEALKGYAQDAADAKIAMQKIEDEADKLKGKMADLGYNYDENSAIGKYDIANEEQLHALAEQTDALLKEKEAYQETYNTAVGMMETTEEVQEELGDKIDETAQKVDSFSQAEEKAADFTKDMTEEQIAAYEKMRDSIVDSIKSSISMLEEFSGGTEITSEEILNNLNSQIDGLSNWADNMEELAGAAGYGMSEEFYNYLAEMGPSSANMVQALVDSLKGNTGQFSSICQAWTEAMDLETPLAEKTASAYAKIEQETKKFQQTYTDNVGNLYKSSSKYANKVLQEEAEKIATEQKTSGINGIKAYNEGVTEKRGELQSGVTNTLDGAVLIPAQELPQKMHDSALNIGPGVAKGIQESSATAVMAAVDMANNINISFKRTLDINSPSRIFKKNGEYITQGIALGIKDAKSEAQNSITDVCDGLLDTAKKNLDIHSPSKKFKKDVGEQISKGTAFGIKTGAKEATSSLSEMTNSIYKTATGWLNSYKSTHAMSLDDEKYYWKKVASTTQNAIAKDIAKKSQWVQEQSRIGKMSLVEQKRYLDKAAQAESEGMGNIYKALQKASKIEKFQREINEKAAKNFGVNWFYYGTNGETLARTEEEYYSEIYSQASKYFSNYSVLHNVSLQEEEYYWQQVQKKLKKGSQQYIDATQKLKEVQSQIKQAAADQKQANKEYGLSGDALESYKTYYEVSAKAEYQYWDIVRKQFKTGTAERIEADKKYFEAKENYNSKLENLNQEYYDNCKEVNEKLEEDIKDLTDTYNDAVSERKDNIYSSFNLFDQFESTSSSGKTLLYNLKTQVAGIADWEQQLQALGKKGILSDGLMKELQEMGPEASASIHALNQLSTSELAEYEKLYEQKNSLAESQAVKENESLRKETQERIKELKSQTQVELNALKKEYDLAVKELKKTIESPLKTLAKQATTIGEDAAISLIAGIKSGASKKSTTADLKKVTTKVSSSLGKLPKAGKTIGENTLQGILNGLHDEKKINSSAKTLIDAIKKAIQKAADIHSPSQLFKKEIGVQLTAGVAGGITEEAGTAEKAGTDMIKGLLDKQKEELQRQQVALKGYMANINGEQRIAQFNNLMSVAPVQQINANVDNTGLMSLMGEMINVMQQGFESMANMQLVTDTGALIGETSTGMSEEFAKMSRRLRK